VSSRSHTHTQGGSALLDVVGDLGGVGEHGVEGINLCACRLSDRVPRKRPSEGCTTAGRQIPHATETLAHACRHLGDLHIRAIIELGVFAESLLETALKQGEHRGPGANDDGSTSIRKLLGNRPAVAAGIRHAADEGDLQGCPSKLRQRERSEQRRCGAGANAHGTATLPVRSTLYPMAMLDAAAARRLEVLGAARVEAAAGVYDTPLRSEPTRPNAPTAGAKAAELATAHASKIDLTNAIVPVAAADSLLE